MISWQQVNNLQDEKLRLEVKLNELIHNPNSSKDDRNELKAEILHLNKQIEKIIGTKELKRQEEIKKKKLGIDDRNIKAYYNLKNKYKKICKLKIAIDHMFVLIENIMYNKTNEEEKQEFIENDFIVKVKK